MAGGSFGLYDMLPQAVRSTLLRHRCNGREERSIGEQNT